MTAIEQAIAAAVRFLEQHHVPYMVIGGVANLVWGEPRSTLDVDMSVLVEEAVWEELIQDLSRAFRMVPRNPVTFLHDTHVLPVETHDGVRIDLLWAQTPYEVKAIARAATEDLAGCRVRVCRPEDLIIHKLLAGRPRDLDDMRGIVQHQGTQLDRRYVLRTARQLATALDQPDLLTMLRALLADTDP